MSTQDFKVSDLVKHFADNGDIGAFHTGIASVVESRVAALVEAHKAEQIRDRFGLQEAVEDAAAEDDVTTEAGEGEPEEAPETKTETKDEADAEETTTDVEAEADADGVDDEAETDGDEVDETTHKEPLPISENFRRFARKRK